MRFFIYLNYVLLTLFILSCERQSTAPDKDRSYIYFNSFESDADTVNWEGFGIAGFSDDAAPGYGKRALVISGGCIIPHCSYLLNPIEEAGHYYMTGWAKVIESSGSIGLVSPIESRIFDISIINPDWNRFKTDTVFVAAGGQLRISMASGGFMSGMMLVDGLQIDAVQE